MLASYLCRNNLSGNFSPTESLNNYLEICVSNHLLIELI
jgi:hypothetical protein